MKIMDIKKWQFRINRSLNKLTACRSLILMYHRVAEAAIDPWALAVTPEHFAQQMEVLKKYARPVRLPELATARNRGKMAERGVAITFDDGYADNLYHAKPVLETHRIPATVFVTTGYTEKQREFWWDELENICFQPETLPEKLKLNLNGHSREWELGEAVHRTETERNDYKIRAWEARPGTRMHLYLSVWEALQKLREAERENALRQIREWADFRPAPRTTHRPMSPDELRALESGGWVEIGAHTVNHPALGAQPASTQKAEIEQGKTYLEKLLNHPVPTFSYPFGDYDNKTRSIVKKAGFMCACSTTEGTVGKWGDRFALPRMAALDWDGAAFEERLLHWFDQ